MNSQASVTQDHNPHLRDQLAAERAQILRDQEWQLHNECIALAREALEHYKAQGEKHLRIPDLTRLLHLASRLGRLATGIPTEYIHHDWPQYENPPGWDQFQADLKRIYGNAKETAAEEPQPFPQNRSADFSRPVGTVSQAASPTRSATATSGAEIQSNHATHPKQVTHETISSRLP